VDKLCIALPKAQVGGSYVFLRHFQNYLAQNGIPWTNNLDDDYDFLFFNSWTVPYPVVLRAKQERSNLRVIQRVDGAAQDYGRKDGADWLQRALNTLADLTIFQSAYSYSATFERYHVIGTPGPIIHNPADITHFSPAHDYHSTDRARVISVGWSPNPLKGTWRIPILAEQNPEVEFIVVGQAGWKPTPSNVRALGVLEHDRLPEALRGADAYLSLIENDACPNVILEALACGLPVVYLPSGGVPELVREAGQSFDTHEEFPKALAEVMTHREQYAERARQIAVDYHSPELIFRCYLDAIRESQRRLLPAMPTIMRGYFDHYAFQARQEARKWRNILSGKQPLRKPQ
jgi:glycosyltransferase involved in cell wall biosynthesis